MRGDAAAGQRLVGADFLAANLHAEIIDSMPGFTVAAAANTLAARQAGAVDLALVGVYPPDGSDIDFVRELRCDRCFWRERPKPRPAEPRSQRVR